MPVADTGSKCQSSWAFAAAQTLESAVAILNEQSARSHAVSVQQLIDCDYTAQGCLGGWAARAYKYIGNKGYSHVNVYPSQYLGVARHCNIMAGRDIRKLSYLRSRQYLMISPDMLKFLITYQPVAVSINMNDCVRAYKSGILSQNDCDCTHETYADVDNNAIMMAIGFGTTKPEDKEYPYCEGYWLLRGFIGSNWGDQGTIKLCINKNRKNDDIGTCNVLVYPHLPDVGVLPPYNPPK